MSCAGALKASNCDKFKPINAIKNGVKVKSLQILCIKGKNKKIKSKKKKKSRSKKFIIGWARERESERVSKRKKGVKQKLWNRNEKNYEKLTKKIGFQVSQHVFFFLFFFLFSFQPLNRTISMCALLRRLLPSSFLAPLYCPFRHSSSLSRELFCLTMRLKPLFLRCFSTFSMWLVDY